jgi:hypothetical protein
MWRKALFVGWEPVRDRSPWKEPLRRVLGFAAWQKKI